MEDGSSGAVVTILARPARLRPMPTEFFQNRQHYARPRISSWSLTRCSITRLQIVSAPFTLNPGRAGADRREHSIVREIKAIMCEGRLRDGASILLGRCDGSLNRTRRLWERLVSLVYKDLLLKDGVDAGAQRARQRRGSVRNLRAAFEDRRTLQARWLARKRRICRSI